MPTNAPVPVELPAPVADFFAHETTDPQAVAQCFQESAVVRDENHEHRGRAAIAAWNADVVRRYQFTSEPLTARTKGAQTVVTCRVSGSFPGSPAKLRFRFTVEGQHISRLEVAP